MTLRFINFSCSAIVLALSSPHKDQHGATDASATDCVLKDRRLLVYSRAGYSRPQPRRSRVTNSSTETCCHMVHYPRCMLDSCTIMAQDHSSRRGFRETPDDMRCQPAGVAASWLCCCAAVRAGRRYRGCQRACDALVWVGARLAAVAAWPACSAGADGSQAPEPGATTTAPPRRGSQACALRRAH